MCGSVAIVGVSSRCVKSLVFRLYNHYVCLALQKEKESEKPLSPVSP